MKNHIIALSALMLLSTLSEVYAATMEDKPMATEMKQSMPETGAETMTRPMDADKASKTMMPATGKRMNTGAQDKMQKMQNTKKAKHSGSTKGSAPMMEEGKAVDTMEPMKPDTKESTMPQR